MWPFGALRSIRSDHSRGCSHSLGTPCRRNISARRATCGVIGFRPPSISQTCCRRFLRSELRYPRAIAQSARERQHDSRAVFNSFAAVIRDTLCFMIRRSFAAFRLASPPFLFLAARSVWQAVEHVLTFLAAERRCGGEIPPHILQTLVCISRAL